MGRGTRWNKTDRITTLKQVSEKERDVGREKDRLNFEIAERIAYENTEH